MGSPTPNKGYTYPAHGGAVDAWDSPLNTNFDQIDLNVAGAYNVTLSTTTAAVTYGTTVTTAPSTVATLTFPSSIAQNLYYLLTGTITANLTLNFPAAGGLYVISNGSSGAFSVVAANSGGGTTSTIGQGGTTIVVSEGATNMDPANSNVIAKLYTYLGNPNGAVTGSVATSNGGVTDFTWDGTNRILYAAVGGSSWHVAAPSLPSPQTYLSPTTGTPIILADTTSSAVYLNRFVGAWVTAPASDGLSYFPYQLSADLGLLLTNIGSSDIVDVYLTQLSSLGVFLGTSPSWSIGGGSVTHGACSRGAGAGSAAITRTTVGFYVNTNTMTLTGGTTAIAGILPGAAFYLGSVKTAAAGATTCHRSYGQTRMWGISNAYNKQDVVLKVGDTTTAWTIAGGTAFGPANGSSANAAFMFSGLPEETVLANYFQSYASNVSAASVGMSIGYNSITTPSGFYCTPTGVGTTARLPAISNYTTPTQPLGVQDFVALQSSYLGNITTLYGTEAQMLLNVQWRA